MSGSAIRVLHCIHSLAGGGAERQLNLLARNSQDLGVEHAVFCVSRAGLTEEQVAMPVFQASSHTKWNWHLWGDIAATLRDYRPQVVHAWLPASMTIPALIQARRAGIHAVFSYRTQMIFHRPMAVPEWAVALLYSDRVVSNTPVESCARPFRYLYRVKRGLYIPNGVATAEAARKVSCAITPGTPVKVLFVGRLVVEKNLECLLRALAEVKDIDWRLTVCGRGAEEAQLRALADTLHIAERIEWLGYRTDVARIMAEHDFLVLPSWREGSPNVALEAMATGLPCILSRAPGNVALFEGPDAALLFDPASVTELAAALRRMMTEQNLRARLRSQAGSWVSGFRPEEIARSYALFYHHLMAARP